MKAYKGFDKDLKCRGFQYEIGGEYHEDDAELCNKGFHACEYPLDCFGYYPPAESRYCEVEIDDNGQRNDDDTKVCGKNIKIGAEIGIKEIVKAAVEYIKSRCTNEERGADKASITGGDRSALTGGYVSALTGGYGSALTGGYGSALTGGYGSALTGGDRSALTGGCGSALTGGYGSALTGGKRSALTGGKFSVVYGGDGAKVRGGMHAVLALQYWVDGELVGVKVKVVDGEKIKPDTWYRLDKAGRFVKAKEVTT